MGQKNEVITGPFFNWGFNLALNLGLCTLWQYWLWSFQTGGTKLERFLHKNQHTQRKLLNFEFWKELSCQK